MCGITSYCRQGAPQKVDEANDGRMARCCLPGGHSGPHEAVTASGKKFRWEPKGVCTGGCSAGECSCFFVWEVTT